MKGPELVFVSMGLTFFLVAVFAYLNGAVIERQGEECASGNTTRCDQSVRTAEGILAVTPYLFVAAVLFVALGFGWVWWRRRQPPGPPFKDEGPPYP